MLKGFSSTFLERGFSSEKTLHRSDVVFPHCLKFAYVGSVSRQEFMRNFSVPFFISYRISTTYHFAFLSQAVESVLVLPRF